MIPGPVPHQEPIRERHLLYEVKERMFRENSEISRMQPTMTKISTVNDYKCARCGKIFETMDVLTEHSKKEHGPKTPIIVTTGIGLGTRLSA